MPDEKFGFLIQKPDGQVVEIFSATYNAKNDYKPWIGYCAGISESLRLDNYNVFSIGLLVNVSTAYFFQADYCFNVPNQQVTSGTYKINGTSLGLSIQYIFMGASRGRSKVMNSGYYRNREQAKHHNSYSFLGF